MAMHMTRTLDPELAKQPSAARKYMLCLALSLLVNGLLLGFILLPHVEETGMNKPIGGGSPPQRMVEQIIHSLSPADAVVVRQAYADRADVFEQNSKARAAAFSSLAMTLKQPNLDVSALQTSLDAVALAHNQMQQSMQSFVKQIATHMSADGRTIMAEKGLPPSRPRYTVPPAADADMDAPSTTAPASPQN